MITNTKLLILSLVALLMTNQAFSQLEDEIEPEVEQKLSLNLGVFSYTSFKENSIEDKINFRPVLSLTYNNRYEIGFSYINLFKTGDHKKAHTLNFNNVTLEENKSYLGAYAKGYFGKNQNFTCQVGYNKVEHNHEQHDFITGYHNPNSPTEISNERKTYNLYTRQKTFYIGGGYSYKVTPQFFIESQIAYLSVNRTRSNYHAIVNNTAFLHEYPYNTYEVRSGEKQTFNDIQFSLTFTYRFTLIKKE